MNAIFTQLFFAEGRLLGSCQRPHISRAGRLEAPDSLLFFCDCCGEVYAKAPVTTAANHVSPWQSIRRRCSRCGLRNSFEFPFLCPGSIICYSDSDYIAALPVPVWQYETERHFQAMEKLK
jgi:hypothetical protein